RRRLVGDGEYPLHQVEVERGDALDRGELVADQPLLGGAVHLLDAQPGPGSIGHGRDGSDCIRRNGTAAARFSRGWWCIIRLCNRGSNITTTSHGVILGCLC